MQPVYLSTLLRAKYRTYGTGLEAVVGVCYIWDICHSVQSGVQVLDGMVCREV